MPGISFYDVHHLMRTARSCYREDGDHLFEWNEYYYSEEDDMYFKVLCSVQEFESGKNRYVRNDQTQMFEDTSTHDARGEMNREQSIAHYIDEAMSNASLRDMYARRQISMKYDEFSLDQLRDIAKTAFSDEIKDPYSYIHRLDLQDHMTVIALERMDSDAREYWARTYLETVLSSLSDDRLISLSDEGLYNVVNDNQYINYG